jgi:GNAT superfamily N-acetyltransferase
MVPRQMRPTLGRLPASDLDPAARLLGRAFQESPNFVSLWPDPRRRARALPPLMRAGARDALRHGEVHTAHVEGALAAVACWLPPGRHHMSPGRRLRAFPDALRAGLVSPGAIGRLSALGATIERLHPADPHWYLAVLGVEPPLHRRGVGGALLRPVLDRADAERMPCYLETPTRDNVRFYERLGFAVVEETPLLPGGPVNWTMLRPPAPD